MTRATRVLFLADNARARSLERIHEQSQPFSSTYYARALALRLLVLSFCRGGCSAIDAYIPHTYSIVHTGLLKFWIGLELALNCDVSVITLTVHRSTWVEIKAVEYLIDRTWEGGRFFVHVRACVAWLWFGLFLFQQVDASDIPASFLFFSLFLFFLFCSVFCLPFVFGWPLPSTYHSGCIISRFSSAFLSSVGVRR